jgi:hypothetical protein
MYSYAIRMSQEQLTSVQLAYFADMGTKKEKAILTLRPSALLPRFSKANSLLFSLVDARWDICRGGDNQGEHIFY